VRAAVEVRRGLAKAHRDPIGDLLAATGFFNAEELEVALELVDDRLRLGEDSHYRFLVASLGGRVVGYACWGPIPGTAQSVDLYWIAVDPESQGIGVGRALLAESERWVGESGRSRVYVETAGRARYQRTRAFYHACGYEVAAELDDFYAPGDAKVVLLKVLSGR
jgi:GNAT superfamily N-acetyltransferase